MGDVEHSTEPRRHPAPGQADHVERDVRVDLDQLRLAYHRVAGHGSQAAERVEGLSGTRPHAWRPVGHAARDGGDARRAVAEGEVTRAAVAALGARAIES